MRRTVGLFLVCVAAAGLGADVSAAEQGASPALRQEQTPKTEMVRVTGQVSAVSRQGIAVEYAKTSKGSKEMYLPLAEKVRLQRLQDVRELKAGDTVEIQYQRTYQEGEKGKRIILDTMAMEIRLLKKAPEGEALVSKEELE